MPRKLPFARIMTAFALTSAVLVAVPTSRADDVPNTDDAPRERARSVIARVAATGRANTLVSAAYLTNLLDTLRGGGDITLFAPTDEAFARLPKDDLAALLREGNQDKLAEILKFHVVAGRITADELTSRGRLQTANGGRLTVAANGRGVAVDDATVVKADIKCRNGVVHLIVAWDNERQEGYLTLVGLAGVDPRRGAYQLWIFDAKRDARYPVDGGLFTLAEGGRSAVVIPIRAAVPVRRPTLFAITLEPPEGVVVSDRKRIMLTAAWQGPAERAR